MKRILLLPIIAAFAIPLSCTKDFERINTNPTAASPASFDANYFLSNAQNIADRRRATRYGGSYTDVNIYVYRER